MVWQYSIEINSLEGRFPSIILMSTHSRMADSSDSLFEVHITLGFKSEVSAFISLIVRTTHGHVRANHRVIEDALSIDGYM